MLTRVAADLVVCLHFAFILFVLVGALGVYRWSKLAWAHIPAVIWAALLEFADLSCPLTTLENHLRFKMAELGYSSGFIEYYLVLIIYPSGLNRMTQILLGTVTVAVNIFLYSFLLVKRNRHHR